MLTILRFNAKKIDEEELVFEQAQACSISINNEEIKRLTRLMQREIVDIMEGIILFYKKEH